MKAKVQITLKHGVLDPQGKAAHHALENLGFSGIESVRVGKLIEVEINENDAGEATSKIQAMCEKLLANTVIENYDVEIEG